MFTAAVIVACWALVPVFSATSGDVGPGRVTLSATRQSGTTAIDIEPLGTVSADTHSGPLGLRAEIGALDLDEVERFATSEPEPEEIEQDVSALVRSFAIRTVGTAAAVGAVIGAASTLVTRRRPSRSRLVGAVLSGLLLAAGTSAAVIWASVASFDVAAMSEARYSGPIRYAPKLVGDVSAAVRTAGELEDRLGSMSARIQDLYSAIGNDPTEPGGDTTTILHVSDIHLNPIGVELTARLADNFGVDAVIDTGDFTSFGTDIESRFIDTLAGIDVPYLLVAGNHDRGVDLTAAVAAQGRNENVTVVEGDTDAVIDVAGIRVAAFPDPVQESLDEPKAVQRAQLRAQRERISDAVTGADIDLVAVHNPVQLTAVTGKVPVAIAGHTHEFSLDDVDGTTIAVTASTGAGGVGSITGDSGGYGAELLRFSGNKLVAVDQIDVGALDGSFHVSRHLTPVESGDTFTALIAQLGRADSGS